MGQVTVSESGANVDDVSSAASGVPERYGGEAVHDTAIERLDRTIVGKESGRRRERLVLLKLAEAHLNRRCQHEEAHGRRQRRRGQRAGVEPTVELLRQQVSEGDQTDVVTGLGGTTCGRKSAQAAEKPAQCRIVSAHLDEQR